MALSAEYVKSMIAPMGRDAAPQAKLIASYVMSELQDRGLTIRNLWGYDPNPNNSEHHSGRAIDFMTHKLDDKVGDVVCDILWERRNEFGLQHLIWRQRIKSTDPRYSPGVWVKMEDRGSTTENHRDHVHAMFYPFKWSGDVVPIKVEESVIDMALTSVELRDALLGIKYGDQNQLGRLNETYRLSTYIPVISDELKALSAAVADTRDAVKALDERIARLE